MVDILHRVGVQAPLDEVYDALATPAGVAGWWTTDTTGDTEVGGKLRASFVDENGVAVYRRWGFTDVGHVGFDIAGEHQRDRVLLRALT